MAGHRLLERTMPFAYARSLEPFGAAGDRPFEQLDLLLGLFEPGVKQVANLDLAGLGAALRDRGCRQRCRECATAYRRPRSEYGAARARRRFPAARPPAPAPASRGI